MLVIINFILTTLVIIGLVLAYDSIFSFSFQYSLVPALVEMVELALPLHAPLFFCYYPLELQCLLRAGQHIHLCNTEYVHCIHFLKSRKF